MTFITIFAILLSMESLNIGPEFIEEKYPDTADKKRPRLPVSERFKRIKNNPRASARLEHLLMDSFVLDISDETTLLELAKSLYESEKRVAIERGQGGEVQELELNDGEILNKYREAILEKEKIQRKSLESWFNYLKEGEDYPIWFKYYVVRSLKHLGQFSRDEKNYAHRTSDTIAPFPEMNAESLAFVFKALTHEFTKENFNPEIGEIFLTPEEEAEVKSKIKDESKLEFALKGRLRNKRGEVRKELTQNFEDEQDKKFADGQSLDGERREDLTRELSEKLKTKDFAKLYAFAQIECAGNLDRESLQGEWVKYPKGSDYTVLEKALQGKGTGWCTAEGSAKGQVENGDFYVYYTKNKAGGFTEPRIAILMVGDSLDQVRGVDPKQELEPDLVETARKKYQDLPGAEKYEKADRDMKKMTQIYRKCFSIDKATQEKTYLNSTLTKDDLIFLYEVNSSIEGFGYEKDPRIAEIRSKRNQQEDLPILFDCRQDQIAFKPSDLKADSLAYIGTWNPTILKSITPNVKYIYESFPDKRAFLKEIIPDPEINSAETAIAKLEAEGHKISDYPKDMLTKVNWQEKPKSSYEVVSFSVADLFGDKNSHTFGDIKAKAQELGLDLIPQALSPSIRLNYPKDGEWTTMALKESIRGRDGNLRIFYCSRSGSESWLDNRNGHDGLRWNHNDRFFFVRK